MEIKRAQCARCEEIHEMTAQLLKEGCPTCGSRVLRFSQQLSPITEEKKHEEKEIEPSIEELIIGDTPTTIKVIGEGKYEIDLEALMKQEQSAPIIISQQEGKYKLSFPGTKGMKKKKS